MSITEWPESLRQALFMFTRTWLAIATAIIQNPKPSLQECSRPPLMERLRKEALLHFNSSSDDAAFHRVEAILDLDEQMIAITESFKQKVMDEDYWQLAV